MGEILLYPTFPHIGSSNPDEPKQRLQVTIDQCVLVLEETICSLNDVDQFVPRAPLEVIRDAVCLLRDTMTNIDIDDLPLPDELFQLCEQVVILREVMFEVLTPVERIKREPSISGDTAAQIQGEEQGCP